MENNRLTLTIVVDNEVGDGLLNEHGFAVWIELGPQRLLFDTGQGHALLPNCEKLGIDLTQADALIISHGHYDHTGALTDFLARNPVAPLFSGPGFARERFSCHPGKAVRDISIGNTVREALHRLPEARCITVTAPRYLFPGIGISGPIPRQNSFEDTGGPFFLDEDQQQADLLDDELALWFETTEGLLILTGCCHAGLLNTVAHIRRISGITRLHGIIGGLHLLHASAQRLAQTQRFLADCAPAFVVPCHCSGEQATLQLQANLGEDRVQAGRAGQVFTMTLAPRIA